MKATGAGAGGLALLGAAACNRTDALPNIPDNPPSGQARNVVLVILDTLRKDHIGAYGNDRIQTPTFDALAGESLRLERAYPESAPTIPARRAIHTGLRAWPFRDWQRYKGIDVGLYGWQPIPADQTTLAEILQAKGYRTMFVTDNLQQYAPSMNFHRGFEVFEFIRGQTTDGYEPIQTVPPEKVGRALLTEGAPGGTGGSLYFRQYFANTAYRKTEEDWFSPQVFTRASSLLEAAKAKQPFFLVVDNYDPHPPWDPPEEYVSLYDENYDGPEPYAPVYGSSDYLTERQLERMRALYAGEVTMADRWLGRFLQKMEESGLEENTLLVVLSDHGIAFGEHGIVGKPYYALWPEVTDVPFFIRHPEGKAAGESSDHYASTHDVAPTILGFLGVEAPEPMDGQDLTVLLDGGEPEPRPHFTLGYHDFVYSRDDRYAMFSRNDGKLARLYDLREDPEMKNNIAAINLDTLNRMFNDYVLEDAGGPLPRY